MKTLIIAITALAVGFGAAYLIVPRDSGASTTATRTAGQQYTCGMHPEIVSDEPGYCPICSMKLTPKKDGTGSAGTISIDPTTSQNMGVATSEVSRRAITRTVRAFGKVVIAEPAVHSVNVKFDGWVERLYVDREGDRVFKGQPLFEVYSPDLVAAQREFLVALKAGAGEMTDLLKATRARLANWDISDDQIQTLRESGEVTRTLTVRAPADGVVTAKHVVEGDRVRPGMEIYQVVDLSSVWVVAQIYEQDLPFVHEGQRAEGAFPNQGWDKLGGTVSYVAPFLDSRGQVEIRIDLANRDFRLRPEMYAEVMLMSELPGQRPAIPRSAIINSGARQVVYVAAGNVKFEPRLITVGATGDNDLVEVTSGLDPGDQIVVSGQFMLDSETRLAEALSTGAMGGHNHEGHTAETAMPEASAQSAGHDMASHDEQDTDEPVAVGGHDIYTCPMPEHFHVLQYGKGTCSECGMKLVPLGQTNNTKAYVCPMTECQTVQDHPGTCPKCNMNLVRYQPEEHHGH